MPTVINTSEIKNFDTPFYYYDLELLEETLKTLQKSAENHNFHIHYALKANNNPKILTHIQSYGFGADCVSGNEIETAIAHQFSPDKIFFAGVGKTDKEIKTAIRHNIFCFNVESVQELEVINFWAAACNTTVRIALRINPNIDAKTHEFISTGKSENKFGIPDHHIPKALQIIDQSPRLNFIGLHVHIGSQIMDLEVYKMLCQSVNYWNSYFLEKKYPITVLNMGGGLGIDYRNPTENPIPDFEQFFKVFAQNLVIFPNQEVHFELGRSIVGQCGNLIAKVLYLKEGLQKTFAIIDAGMTDLIRPALYQAEHKIEVLDSKSDSAREQYEIVGPVCETSDSFARSVNLPILKRGDYIIIKSAGAYGEVMTSEYNMRNKTPHYFKEQI